MTVQSSTSLASALRNSPIMKSVLARLGRLVCRPTLSVQERQQYARDGFLVIDPHVPPEWLRQARDELMPQFPQMPPGTSGYPLCGRIQDAWKTCQAVKHLARADYVLRSLWDLYGRRPLPFQTLNFPVGTEQRVHSDTIHFNSMPAGWMCGVWFALEDIDMDNGPLVYYPGSHKLPEYNLQDVGAAIDWDQRTHYRLYEAFIARLIKQNGLQPHYATIKKGQAFIWASNLLHGGSSRRDRNRSRHSQVTHYFFPGCKYYTPLFSEGSKTQWRQPEWITDSFLSGSRQPDDS